MDDKVFNLLEKMYAEMNERFDGVGKEIKELRQGQIKIESILENEVKPDIKLALQGYHDTNEKLTAIEQKLEAIESKIETHDVEISVIKRVK